MHAQKMKTVTFSISASSYGLFSITCAFISFYCNIFMWVGQLTNKDLRIIPCYTHSIANER